MTANKPMTGEQLDELMTVAVNFQRDSEKAGEGDGATFAYAVQVAVLEIREVRSMYEELQSQNADMAVQLANAESKCRELAAENSAIKVMNDCLSEEMRGYESDGAFEGPKMHLLWWKVKTPAADAFLAEMRAQGVEMYADTLDRVADDAERDGFEYGMKFLRAEAEGVRKFAAQLRKGAAL
ncbi:MAG: hypothetical protein RSD83_20635 [Hafnia sp.]|uniref:hypothetical protein n=1 Tax=Hafnia sp. TaxID=1873498 RepID=UPI002FC95F7A